MDGGMDPNMVDMNGNPMMQDGMQQQQFMDGQMQQQMMQEGQYTDEQIQVSECQSMSQFSNAFFLLSSNSSNSRCNSR